MSDWETHAKLAAITLRSIADRIERGGVCHHNVQGFYDPAPPWTVWDSEEHPGDRPLYLVKVNIPREAVDRRQRVEYGKQEA